MFPDNQGTPPSTRSNLQEFYATTPWANWVKPRGVSMVYITCIGSGSGGGGGMTGATATVRGGGGGGASGAIARLIIPARFLPDTLYLQVGVGGAGGAAAGAGGAGNRSFVSVAPNTTRSRSLWTIERFDS